MASPTHNESTISIGEKCEVAISPARQLPAPQNQPAPGIKQLAHNYTELAGQAIEFAKIAAFHSWRRARHAAIDNSCRAAYTTHDIVTRTRNHARNYQRQYPMRVLGILAGTAFLAGIAARIWRSRAL